MMLIFNYCDINKEMIYFAHHYYTYPFLFLQHSFITLVSSKVIDLKASPNTALTFVYFFMIVSLLNIVLSVPSWVCVGGGFSQN